MMNNKFTGCPVLPWDGYPNGCWAASGAAVCQYYGASASLVTFSASAGVSPSNTASMSVIQYGLSKYGISSTIYASNATESGIAALQGQINIGRPVIVNVTSHAVVLAGADSTYFYIMDPQDSTS